MIQLKIFPFSCVVFIFRSASIDEVIAIIRRMGLPKSVYTIRLKGGNDLSNDLNKGTTNCKRKAMRAINAYLFNFLSIRSLYVTSTFYGLAGVNNQ